MGSSPTVTPTSESMNSIMGAMIKNLPQYASTINSIIGPTQQAEVDANRQIVPQQNQLSLEQAQQYLPALTQLDTENAKTRALGTVASDTAALKAAQNSGLIEHALALQKQADPEYYKNRDVLSSKLGQMAQFDPNNLSGSEVANVNRGLNQTAAGAPNLGAALSAAATFGNALAKRRGENQGYVQTIASSLPTLRSGFDPYMVATGKNSGPGQAAMGERGYQNGMSSTAQGYGNQMFGTAAQLQSQAAQNEYGKPTGLDQAGKIMGMAGKLIGGIAGAGMGGAIGGMV